MGPRLGLGLGGCSEPTATLTVTVRDPVPVPGAAPATAANAEAAGSIPGWAIHVRVGLGDPCGPLPAQDTLGFCVCASVPARPCPQRPAPHMQDVLMAAMSPEQGHSHAGLQCDTELLSGPGADTDFSVIPLLSASLCTCICSSLLRY